jgi:hypothetical protein
LIGLVLSLVVTIAIAVQSSESVFADKCKKNHEKNCNNSEKNQKSIHEINCDVHMKGEDHSDNIFGSTDQQCEIKSTNIKDSNPASLGLSPGGNNSDSDTAGTATLVVSKVVDCTVDVGDPPGAICPGEDEFQITISGENVSPVSFAGNPKGTVVSLDGGHYRVTETAGGGLS